MASSHYWLRLRAEVGLRDPPPDDKPPPVDDAIDAELRDDVFPRKAEMPDEIG